MQLASHVGSCLAKEQYVPPPRNETPEVNALPRCPVTEEKDGQEQNILSKFDEDVKKHAKLDTAALAELEKNKIAVGLFEKIKNQVTGFFDSLSELGRANDSPKNKFSVIAGTATTIAFWHIKNSPIFKDVVKTAMQSFHSCFTSVASVLFESNVDEVARTAFSGLCILSAALRATIPVMRQLATDSHDATAILVFTAAAFVLSCVYAATSFTNFLLASHDAIALPPKDSEVMKFLKSTYKNAKKEIQIFINNPKRAEAIASWAVNSIKEKLESVSNANFNGGVSTAREFLMLTGAVLSIVALKASAPVLLIAAGAANFFANLCDVIQGAHDCHIFNKKLNGLEEQKTKLESDLNKPDLSVMHKAIVTGHLKNIKTEIDKTRSDLRASGLRVVKGAVGALCSLASVGLGVLMQFCSITVPILPLIVTVVSLVAVIVLSSVGLARRKINKQDEGRETIEKKEAEQTLPVININNEAEIKVDIHRTDNNQEFLKFLNKYILVGFMARDFLSGNEDKTRNEMYEDLFSDEQREVLEKIVRSYKAGRIEKNLEEIKQVGHLKQKKLDFLQELMQLSDTTKLEEWTEKIKNEGKQEQVYEWLHKLTEPKDAEQLEEWKKEMENGEKQEQVDEWLKKLINGTDDRVRLWKEGKVKIEEGAEQELQQIEKKGLLKREKQLEQLEQQIAQYLKIKIEKSKAKDKRPQETTGAPATSPSSGVIPTHYEVLPL
jgi:hypothetical protein